MRYYSGFLKDMTFIRLLDLFLRSKQTDLLIVAYKKVGLAN